MLASGIRIRIKSGRYLNVNQISTEYVIKSRFIVVILLLLLVLSVSYLVAMHTECEGNELHHSNIMTAFHLLPSTLRFER